MIEPNTQISNAKDRAYQGQICTIDYWYTKKDQELFKSVIAKFGIEHQIALFTEECAETLVAMSKYRRKRAGSNAVVEELVDLSIMIAQMRLIYDPADTEFDVMYKYKINRLHKILEGK